MIYTNKRYLSIYETPNPIDKVSFSEIKKSLLSIVRNTIYFVSAGKLYGLITSGDISRAIETNEREVTVNKRFSKIMSGRGDYYAALLIFKNNKSINAVPVVDEKGSLIGEYNRFDDILSIMHGYLLEDNTIKMIGKAFHRIGIITSDNTLEEKKSLVSEIQAALNKACKRVDIINCTDYIKNSNAYDIIITVDRDDAIGIGSVAQIEEKGDFRTKNKPLKDVTELAEIINVLHDIEEEGIKVFNLFFETNSAYSKKLLKQIREKNKQHNINSPYKNYVIPEIAENFFGELDSDEYRKYVGIEQGIEIVDMNGVALPKDFEGKYRNYKNGERKTFFQPENPTKTIYFFGPCLIRGAYVEDKHTIQSQLQRMLNVAGYNVKVVNLGDFSDNEIIHLRYIKNKFNSIMKKGDIVITYFRNQKLNGFENINLMDALEEKNPSEEWFTNIWLHCNNKVNEIYAEKICRKLTQKKYLEEGSGEFPLLKFDDFFTLEKYFYNVNISEYKRVGAIVMNCNPFTWGHRYLIEQAKKHCDFLIIFVVSEDKSLFSFNQRYAMVKAGTKDLNNVFVSPSGYSILSAINFPEYFGKTMDDNVIKNAEKDIEVFVKEIAPKLNISVRFVGEELSDPVTEQYNIAMKTILPKYGMELIEIPRKKRLGKVISATRAREALEKDDFDSLKEFVPQSSLEVIFWNNN